MYAPDQQSSISLISATNYIAIGGLSLCLCLCTCKTFTQETSMEMSIFLQKVLVLLNERFFIYECFIRKFIIRILEHPHGNEYIFLI